MEEDAGSEHLNEDLVAIGDSREREVTASRVPGERAGSTVIVTDDHFKFHKHRAGRKCHLWKNENYKCPVKLRMTGERFFCRGVHNHSNEEESLKVVAFQATCKSLAATEPGRPRHLFEAARREHADAVAGYGPSLEKSMQRSRNRARPPVPQTIGEAEQLLLASSVYRKTIDGNTEFFHGRVNSATGSAFIFLSLFLLEQLASSVELHADGTFRNMPHLFYQLFTVHIVYKDKYFPIAYVMMTEKTTDLYTTVLKKIMEVFHEKFPGRDCSVNLMISDFEQAIISAMQTTFPSGRARGCWFHYAQAIYRKACELGLQTLYRSSEAVKKVVKWLIALALAPSGRTGEGFWEIRRNASNLLHLESQETKAKIDSLFEYFGATWFALFTPDKWSVYRDKRRSNNGVESHNRTFHARFTTETRNNFWEFLKHLQEDEESKRRDFKALSENLPIGRRRPGRENRRDEDIINLTSDLDSGGISLFEFIEAGAIFFEPDPQQRQVTVSRRMPLNRQPRPVPSANLPSDVSINNLPAVLPRRGRGRPRRVDRAEANNAFPYDPSHGDTVNNLVADAPMVDQLQPLGLDDNTLAEVFVDVLAPRRRGRPRRADRALVNPTEFPIDQPDQSVIYVNHFPADTPIVDPPQHVEEQNNLPAEILADGLPPRRRGRPRRLERHQGSVVGDPIEEQEQQHFIRNSRRQRQVVISHRAPHNRRTRPVTPANLPTDVPPAVLPRRRRGRPRTVDRTPPHQDVYLVNNLQAALLMRQENNVPAENLLADDSIVDPLQHVDQQHELHEEVPVAVLPLRRRGRPRRADRTQENFTLDPVEGHQQRTSPRHLRDQRQVVVSHSIPHHRRLRPEIPANLPEVVHNNDLPTVLAPRGRGRPRRINMVQTNSPDQSVDEPIPIEQATNPVPSNGILCEICSLLPKNTAFVPCGHTCCHICASKVERFVEGMFINDCFYCRTPVLNSLNIRL